MPNEIMRDLGTPVSIEDLDDRRIINASNYVLTQDSIVRGRNLVIWADHLTIETNLNFVGQSVLVCARKLVAKGHIVIDASGNAGEGFGANSGRHGVEYSEDGKDGKSGQNGNPGGSVYLLAKTFEGKLTILSRGGAGGRGENGGNGATGRVGRRGQDGQDSRPSRGTKGEQGGQGGNGGKAGISGDGGSGGRIFVSIIDPIAEDAIECFAEGGSGGEAALHGLLGRGGPGGHGGLNYKCTKEYL